ncbi:glycoside hydrolase family 6 protein [Rhizobium sp. RCC_161_2]|uniref:glycoside hydrolase family 6 protein n=1 Tax=Rhizobium sp. RCC_161_2 TaxID=3239219 RepID=UPI0035251A4C
MRLKHLIFIAVAFLFATQETRAADSFYVDAGSTPAIWVRQHPDDPRAAKIATSIATVPTARWFGDWSGDIRLAVAAFVDKAATAGQTPILVAYDIPNRDCAGESAGGAGDTSAYRRWIDSFSQGIGKRTAIVIVEPDSVAQIDCLKTVDLRQTRLALLRYAVSRLHLNAPAADIYLDAGNAHWIPAATMAARLVEAGIGDAKGFALNVSNFYTTEESVAYAKTVNAALADQLGHPEAVVIDTSRNGDGSHGQWCNPPGARLGERTHFLSDQILLAWVKVPGNSDGKCGIGSSWRAGFFSPELAVRLIDGN